MALWWPQTLPQCCVPVDVVIIIQFTDKKTPKNQKWHDSVLICLVAGWSVQWERRAYFHQHQCCIWNFQEQVCFYWKDRYSSQLSNMCTAPSCLLSERLPDVFYVYNSQWTNMCTMCTAPKCLLCTHLPVVCYMCSSHMSDMCTALSWLICVRLSVY